MTHSEIAKTLETPNNKIPNIIYWVILLSIFSGFALSIVSWEKICSQACSEGHNYRLYRQPFEFFGFAYFITLGIIHIFSRKYSLLLPFMAILLVSGLASETVFIYLQKYKIGKWCPVCLAIAATIGIAFIAFITGYFYKLKSYEDQIMKHLANAGIGTFVFIASFFFVFFGVEKHNPLLAQENTIKENIVFGNHKSPVEVYVFTDWACPACRSLEPALEKMSSEIMKKAKLTFVDFAVHTETLNYTPYNLSFMVYNKDKYFKLRNALSDLSEKTGTPTDQQIEKLAISVGTRYRQLNYSDVALGIKYYKHLIDQLNIEGTPTIAVINRDTKKGKKLAGTTEISEENVLKAIDTLK